MLSLFEYQQLKGTCRTLAPLAVDALQPLAAHAHLAAVGRAAEARQPGAAMRRAEGDDAMHPRAVGIAQPGPGRQPAHAVADQQRRLAGGGRHAHDGGIDGLHVAVDRTERPARGRPRRRHGRRRAVRAARASRTRDCRRSRAPARRPPRRTAAGGPEWRSHRKGWYQPKTRGAATLSASQALKNCQPLARGSGSLSSTRQASTNSNARKTACAPLSTSSPAIAIAGERLPPGRRSTRPRSTSQAKTNHRCSTCNHPSDYRTRDRRRRPRTSPLAAGGRSLRQSAPKEIECRHQCFRVIPAGVPHEVHPEQYRSLAQLFDESFKRYAERPFSVCMERWMTYGELDALSKALGAWLQSLGLEPGARVAIMLPNMPQFAVTMCGVLRAGYTCVNVNPLYTARELEHQLKDSGADRDRHPRELRHHARAGDRPTRRSSTWS